MFAIREENFVTCEMVKGLWTYRIDNFRTHTFVAKTRIVRLPNNTMKCYCVVKTYHRGKLESVNGTVQYFDSGVNTVKVIRWEGKNYEA